uniref:Spindle and centriole-associated protein 1 n=1 Tax=Neolamprologus brichardi TaxID=32507 RepID=A0A3Q4I5W9_NEOBR
MSFVRVGRPQQHAKGKRPVRPKKAAAQRREWVVSIDIKLSCVALLQVFSDQLLLQDVLARSDKALAVVKDLFGDAPRRHTGHPRVTVAPNCDSDSELPVLQRPDRPTHLSLLSQSMMDQEALNELEASEDDHRDDDARPSTSSEYHKCVIFILGSDQEIIYYISGIRGEHKHLSNVISALNATVAVQRVRSRQSQSEDAREETSVLVSQVLNSEPPQSKSGNIYWISNHTSRGRKCVSQGSELDGSSVASLSGDQSSLGLLQAMLGQVESDLDALSPDTAPTSAQSPKNHRTQSLTGFSVALVSTLGRLVHLLKKREDEAQKEAQERRKLEEELKEQQRLIDALTAETMTLREEATALQVRLGLGYCYSSCCQSATGAERVPVSSAVLLSPPQQRDHFQHATSPNTFSANSVEQRLLELNRQSAAARGRLLEIIEQQKQSVSARVSPSVSPIPGWQSTGTQTQNTGTQTHTHTHTHSALFTCRSREGWFALSAHVR